MSHQTREIDAEDIVSESVKEQQLLARNIKGKNVQEVKWIPSKSVSFDNEASTSKTGLGIKELKTENKNRSKSSAFQKSSCNSSVYVRKQVVKYNMPNMHNMPDYKFKS